MKSWTDNNCHYMTRTSPAAAIQTILIDNFKQISPEEMVIAAIRLAKRYNCVIINPVRFVSDLGDDHVEFSVKCHHQTYHFFYEYGNNHKLNNSEVKERDIAKYEELFGTRKCIHKGFKKRWWYVDNWSGAVHEFPTLKAAKKSAKHETGISVTIYTNLPYGKGNSIACLAKASGYNPP